MNKTLKIVGIVLGGVAGLLVILAVVLTLVFDPNQYKPEIIKLVKDKTGRDFKIEQKIGWSFFPRLGIEAGGIELANAPGFGKDPFARLEAAGVHVAVMPLLRGKIEVSSVYLNGLQLNLAKNTAGKTNWDDLVPAEGKKPSAPEKKEATKLPVEGLTIGRLEVRRANLLWRDQQAGSTLTVKNLNLTTSTFVANEPMDLSLAFELARDKAAPIKADLRSRLTASADALKLANVDLKVDDSRLQGSIEIRDFSSPAVRFDLALDKIDLDRYLASGSSTATPAKAAPADQPVEVPLSTLRSLNVNGKFQVGTLTAMGLKSTEAKVVVNAKNGLITLGPNSAKLYQGNYHGQTVVDARGKTLQLKLDEKLEGVQVGPLLKDMKLFDHYSGAGNVSLNLTAQGFDANAIKRSLNGNAAVSIKDGRIDGVDLGKALKTVFGKGDTLTKLTQLVPSPGDHTVFGQMSGTFQVKNGVANNNDLVLRAVDFTATGKGMADLGNEKMDYRLFLANTGEEGKKCKTLPLRIHGSFAKLSYEPDMGLLLECQAKKQVEKQLDKQLEKGLEGLLKPKKKK
jgi:AsmA protein